MTVLPVRRLRAALPLLALIAAAFVGAPRTLAQQGGFGGGLQRAEAELFTRVDGDTFLAALRIQVDPHWHLYHDDLGPVDAAGKPTEVVFDAPGVEWERPVFPEPVRFEQPNIGEGGRDTWIWGHEGEVVVRARGTLSGEPPVDDDVVASIDGQTCEDSGSCLPYSEEVASSGDGPDALFVAFADPDFGQEPTEPAADVASSGETGAAATTGAAAAGGGSTRDSNLGSFLLLAIFWGLFTLLMPCTYPMIPITISFFTKQADSRHTSTLPLSLAYGAGIVGVFVAIGVVVGPVIIAFATHPVTNLVIGLLFLYFALALFGVIQMNPPRFLMDAAGKASSKGGYLGVFLMGTTLVVTSFTCTAPFVGSLLSVGATGEGAGLGRIALGMGVFGATIALPFVGLSMVPARVKQMPKSGEWMHTLKVTLGFVEVAAALKFISNADIVWGWNALPRELFFLLWAAIFVAAALFLFGFVRLEGASGDIGPGRMVAAIAFALLGAYCWYGSEGWRMDPVMSAIAPAYSRDLVPEALASRGGGVERARPVIVEDDLETARAVAVEQGKLLLVNFTGHT